MSKLSALFGVPATTIGGLATLNAISGQVAGVLILILGSIQLAVWAYLSPSVPWLGDKPPSGPPAG